MTAPPRGGARYSMGASLLDAVLAETLDPAYEQAAAARAAGAPRPTRWRGRALVAGTMVVAGLLFSVTYDQAAAGAEGREQVREALISDIQRESDASDELAGQLETLAEEVASTRDDLLATTAGGQRALEELRAAEEGAGAVRVTGPGLLVTLANADPSADDDPVGGTTEQDPREKVQDGDLQLVVNALWGAGAEAISINGQRLGPTSAIRFAGEAVLVDFKPVTSPYEVRAIGDLHTLRDRFVLDPQVQALASLSVSLGLQFDLASREELTLPAATVPELRSASVLGAETDGTAVPDPTPGG